MSKCIQPNDRYCPQCGVDTLRHAPDGTEYYGAHTQETCLEIRLARAQERAERERRNKEFLTDWYSRRIHRLRRLIEEEAPSILDRACAVIANGAADVYERPECGSLSSAPANPYAAVVEAARALAVTLYQHNEAAIKRFHIEVLGREEEIDDDEGDCCEICCEVSDLLYDLGQKLGEIGIDDLSKIPDIRDLAKLDEEADTCDS